MVRLFVGRELAFVNRAERARRFLSVGDDHSRYQGEADTCGDLPGNPDTVDNGCVGSVLIMDSAAWDERYAGSDLVWSATPNVFVEQIASELPPGRVLDIAAGEARNALWLAERGWTATAADFSPVAVDRARRLAVERLGDTASRFTAVVADATAVDDDSMQYDLVLVVYLHLPKAQRRMAIRNAAAKVAAGGRLLVVGHHADNIEQGVGGPQDPNVLFSESDIVADLDGTGLSIVQAERVLRTVSEDGPKAIDALVVAAR